MAHQKRLFTDITDTFSLTSCLHTLGYGYQHAGVMRFLVGGTLWLWVVTVFDLRRGAVPAKLQLRVHKGIREGGM